MKVVLVSMVYPHPRPGIWPGIERHVGEMSRALAAEGVQVTVITTFWNGGTERDRWEGVEILRVHDARERWGRAAHLLNWNARAFSREILRHRDRLAASDAIHAFLGLSTHDELKALGVPLFASFPHREAPRGLKDRLTTAGRFAIEQSFFRETEAVFAGSAAAGDVLVAEYGLEPGKVHIVPLGVDGSTFRPPEPPRPADPCSERPEGIRLLYVGPLIERKDVATLIRALPLLSKSSVPVRLQLVGRGPEQEALQALAERLGVASRISLAGFVKEADLVRHFQEADLFVFPSLKEGFGLVLVEAMACGLPIVTTEIPPMPEVTGEAALHVTPSDPKALADALVKLAKDPGLRVRLSHEGRARVEERYLWSRVARETLEHYERAAKGRGASG